MWVCCRGRAPPGSLPVGLVNGTCAPLDVDVVCFALGVCLQVFRLFLSFPRLACLLCRAPLQFRFPLPHTHTHTHMNAHGSALPPQTTPQDTTRTHTSTHAHTQPLSFRSPFTHTYTCEYPTESSPTSHQHTAPDTDITTCAPPPNLQIIPRTLHTHIDHRRDCCALLSP